MITGRIIRIISKKRVILNIGTADGVEGFMRFAIYTPAEDIVDPKTQAKLGNYRRLKTVIEADEVHEKFTIASRPTIHESRPFEEPDAFPGVYWPDLPVSEQDIRPLPTGDTVRVGDIVEELPQEEELFADEEIDEEATTPADEDILF